MTFLQRPRVLFLLSSAALPVIVTCRSLLDYREESNSLPSIPFPGARQLACSLTFGRTEKSLFEQARERSQGQATQRQRPAQAVPSSQRGTRPSPHNRKIRRSGVKKQSHSKKEQAA